MSWVILVSIFTAIRNKISTTPKFKERVTANELLPIVGSLSGLFMIILGFSYFVRIENIIGYTEMYEEYSTILFYVGSALLLYSSITIYLRNKAREY